MTLVTLICCQIAIVKMLAIAHSGSQIRGNHYEHTDLSRWRTTHQFNDPDHPRSGVVDIVLFYCFRALSETIAYQDVRNEYNFLRVAVVQTNHSRFMVCQSES